VSAVFPTRVDDPTWDAFLARPAELWAMGG